MSAILKMTWAAVLRSMPALRNFWALIVGLILGSLANMALINVGAAVVPPPVDADLTTMEGLRQSMRLFTPLHFIFPFLAHALGTLVGAFTAAKLAKGYRLVVAMIIGGVFLLGGVTRVVAVGGPWWFIVADLGLAYLPTAYLGGKLADGKQAQNQ